MAASTNPLLPLSEGPRLVLYHQTHHGPNAGPPISLLPLISNRTGTTHVVIAAIHVNDQPGHVALNNHSSDDPIFTTLWGEVAWLQASGVKVLGMLGGAAQGTFGRLDGDDPARFESFYIPLRDMVRTHKLDGLDLDIEEPMSMPGIVRLIDRLRADFSRSFLITLAPVATALLVGQPHLSGPTFDYHLLERLRGHEIAWYNVQFYNGWGDASTSFWYEAIIRTGWRAEKVVLGLLTNPAHGGSGYVSFPQIEGVLRALRSRHPGFGGVMGWEYFKALPDGEQRPWEWALSMSRIIRTPVTLALPQVRVPQAPIRPYGAAPPPAPHPFPAESVKTLQELGFSQQQAVAALNSTNGNVEYAAGLLFQE